jgi:hypothetical protein
MMLLPSLNGAPEDRQSDPLTWSHGALVDHARFLFRSLTLNAGPAWERRDLGWRDQCDVHLAEGSCDFPTPVTVPESLPPGAKPSPSQGPIAEGEQAAALHFYRSLMWPSEEVVGAQRAGLSMLKTPKVLAGPLFPSVLQTIYYNAAAAATINSNRMDRQGALEDRLDQLEGEAVPLSDLKVTDFAQDAVVVKTFWELLQPGQNDFPGKNYAYGAWLFGQSTPPDPGNGQVTAFEDKSIPDPTIYIDIGAPKTCTYAPQSTMDHRIFKVYSLGCFYYRSVHPPEVHEISEHASSKSDIPHAAKCEGLDSAYCYLILVGVHVMTRETPNWLWMTFWWNTGWWDSHPARASVRDKWDLFDANATANNTDPVANPYLEGPNTGMYSNCMECHRHAVVRPGYGTVVGANLKHNYFSGIPGTDWGKQIFPLASPPPDPFQPLAVASIPARARDLQSPTCFFAGALQTHFLWTIAMHSASGKPADPCAPLKSPSAESSHSASN